LFKFMIFRHGMSVAEGKPGRKIMKFEVKSIIRRCGESNGAGNAPSHPANPAGMAPASRKSSVSQSALRACVA